MKLITRQTQANEAANRWAAQYPDDLSTPDHQRLIGHRLLALSVTPDPDEIDRIIGNKTWTETPICDECDMRSAVIVQVGEPPNCESATANLCTGCILKAMQLARTATPEGREP